MALEHGVTKGGKEKEKKESLTLNTIV